MMKRIRPWYTYVKDGMNNGFIVGFLLIFFTVIGIPAGSATTTSEDADQASSQGLAPLAIPLFAFLIIIFGAMLVRRLREDDNSWQRMLANGAAMGLAVVIVFFPFMGQVNAWQADPEFSLQSYLKSIRPATTSRLSGVPIEELAADPPIDPITQELNYEEGQSPRTDPMPLYINHDEYVAVDLGLITFGGIQGLMLFLFLVAPFWVMSYWGLLFLDWDRVRERYRDVMQHGVSAEIIHWVTLTLPIALFLFFIATVNTGGPDSDPVLDLSELLNLQQRGTQNTQLIVAFSLIISYLLAMRNSRYRATRIPYIGRLIMLPLIPIAIFGLAYWRITEQEVGFIFPSVEALPESQDISLIVIGLVLLASLIYAIINATQSQLFERTLVTVLGIGMISTLPLFMDQYQTGVLILVAINAMMGLGLNIVVGYAGLLDLGYVAFFAIGAYTFAFVNSNRQQISVDVSNDVLYSVAIAIVVVPIIVFSYLFFTAMDDSEEEEEYSGRTKRMKPLWTNRPRWWVSLILVAFGVAFTLFAARALKQAGIVEELGNASPFLVAMLLGLFAAAFAGIMLGFPVLRLRSDYLAIVTLGFGEIISVALENEDFEPYSGAAQGASGIPKPVPDAGTTIAESQMALLYLAILGCLLVAFISIQLRNSRLGRAWTVLKGDEDIAQAMGVNLVNAKLAAFSIGASFAGLAGVLFASRQTSIFPRDFNLEISIEVLSLVIIGGMGSIPGVIVGAIALIGLPEVLRPLQEYRLLVFGAALVTMMLTRPQGLMPKPLAALEERARKLRAERGDQPLGEGTD